MMATRVSGASALYLLVVLQYSTAALVIPRSQQPQFFLGRASDQCGLCEAEGRYTCLDEVRYGFCFGETTPDPLAIRACPTGKYCSLEDERICVDSAAGEEPSCGTSRSTSTPDDTNNNTSTPTGAPETTPEPAFNETTFCLSQQKTGYVPMPNDPSCKEYIYCYVLSGQVLGKRYVCNDFFNPTTRKCQKQKPEGC